MSATSPYLLRPTRTYSQVALERLQVALETALDAAVEAEASGVRGPCLRLLNLSLQDCISDCKGMLAERVQLFDEAEAPRAPERDPFTGRYRVPSETFRSGGAS